MEAWSRNPCIPPNTRGKYQYNMMLILEYPVSDGPQEPPAVLLQGITTNLKWYTVAKCSVYVIGTPDTGPYEL